MEDKMEVDSEKSSKRRGGLMPTIEQIESDVITKFANKYWAPHLEQHKKIFDAKVIQDLYKTELCGSGFSIKRVMMLEFSQYLENYLWPNYGPTQKTDAHVISIVTMVNEKFRERVPAWEIFKALPAQFSLFISNVCELSLKETLNIREQTVIIVFLIHCFNSLEIDLIREQLQSLLSLPIWSSLLPGRREEMLRNNPRYKKIWKVIQKKDKKSDEKTNRKNTFQRHFLWNHIQKYFKMLDFIEKSEELPRTRLHYCERFLELLIDLLAQLPSRRFFNTVMDDSHVVVKSKLSKLCKIPEGQLFRQLLDLVKFYAGFEISDETGEPLSDHDMTDIHYSRITELQKSAFKHFPELRTFALANVASIDTRENLLKQFQQLSNRKLHEICAYLNLLPPPENDKENIYSTELLLEILIWRHERRTSQLEALNNLPLYPIEDVIWDESVVPTEYFTGENCLALPKLHLQFLTLHDYLLRNFNLFRLESTYEIRQDIEDSVSRMKPWQAEDGSCYFGGWARMAHPMQTFSVVEVAKPNLGENHPARVRADVTINLNLRPQIKYEWENLRKHDVAFLITVRPTQPIGTRYDYKEDFIPQVGLTYVRGCEIEGMLDANGKVIEEGPEPKPELRGDSRSFRVWLDPCQYQQDMANTIKGGEDVYETFNIIMRRKPKENNFKAVLETIRDLMNTSCVVPEWLHNIILGYGDPSAAHYRNINNFLTTLDWNDTFLDINHLNQSFTDFKVDYDHERPEPPYRITFPPINAQSVKRKHDDGEEEDNGILEKNDIIKMKPHIIPNRGPYPANKPKKNAVPFTPTQIEAIKAGMQPGLTMVVGPPGTGKTDVAVQIISNLYHNFPDQRTLIVTHSNQALNQLFEKIMALDIEERHLLRLGHGEESLETDKDFSRYGRVNYVLAQRIELLDEVNRLKESLNVSGDVAYTCETAGYFYLYHVLARWEEYLSEVRPSKTKKSSISLIAELFPFTKFFSNAPQPLFYGRNFDEDWDIAEGCFRHLKQIFTQLDEFRALELLRSGADRSQYLLIKEAKIIAMTCTHAALKRRDLVDMGFQYDNILMEESAQILEIETFIPLLLQNPEHGYNRLKRWIMIGDHNQLPPVIKNMAFQKFSNMEQSLFTRFVNLGVPTIDLDSQGRSRASICALYNWRYKKLGNLPHIQARPEYQLANAGFCFDYQLIDVQDFNGVGESAPNPYFYQNLAEAEYCVALFMYMRLQGYAADKISILTTYNGQKHLIRDVIKQRCMGNPLMGIPHKVTTVDRFQGQQNDYIILSLVRTKIVGHLRDIRRLVVAMSRARLGLYIFARASLFQNCHELSPAFKLLLARPTRLHIAPDESFPANRLTAQRPPGRIMIVEDMPEMAQFVYEHYERRVNVLMQQQKRHIKPQQGLPEPAKASAPVTSIKIEESSEKPAAEENLEDHIKEEQPQKHAMEEHPGADSDSEDEKAEVKEPAEDN